MNRACRKLGKKTPEFTKKAEIHELFVLALSLVWFAGASPDKKVLRAYSSSEFCKGFIGWWREAWGLLLLWVNAPTAMTLENSYSRARVL